MKMGPEDIKRAKIFEAILRDPNSVNVRNSWNGRTFLHNAVKEGDIAIIEAVLKQPVAEIDKYSGKIGYTALMYAAVYNQIDATNLLISHKCDVNKQSHSDKNTALHIAVMGGYVEIVQLLLKSGAKLLHNSDHHTPLDIAICYRAEDPEKYQKIIDLLSPHRDLEKFPTLLHIAAKFGYCDFVDDEVKKSPTNLEKQNWCGTPLHVAIFYGQLEAAKRLVQHGANVNARNIALRTPLHYVYDCISKDRISEEQVSLEMTTLLVENGAKLTIDCNRKSQLDYARLSQGCRSNKPKHQEMCDKIVAMLEKLCPLQFEDLIKQFEKSLCLHSGQKDQAVCHAYTKHRRSQSGLSAEMAAYVQVKAQQKRALTFS